MGIVSNMSRSHSSEVRPDESVSQVNLIPDDGDYNLDEEDLYGPGSRGTLVPSGPTNNISAVFSTVILHFKVTKETLEEARGFLNVSYNSVFH